MPEKSKRLFTVVCKGCGRTLVTVERIRDPEVVALEAHLRACSHAEPLGETSMLGEMMARVRVASVQRASSA